MNCPSEPLRFTVMLMLPKVGSADEVALIAGYFDEADLGTLLHVIIESAAGLEACPAIAWSVSSPNRWRCRFSMRRRTRSISGPESSESSPDSRTATASA